MTPDRLDEIAYRDMHCLKTTQAELDRAALLDHIGVIYAEIDRLRDELIETRLSAQEAWDAYDEKGKA